MQYYILISSIVTNLMCDLKHIYFIQIFFTKNDVVLAFRLIADNINL